MFCILAFIYTMPGYNCSIKERMLYSSCKNSFVEMLESDGIEITKKVTQLLTINQLQAFHIWYFQIEVDSGRELTEDFLQNEIHPKKIIAKTKFARPAPPSRGNRRITKQVWSWIFSNICTHTFLNVGIIFWSVPITVR